MHRIFPFVSLRGMPVNCEHNSARSLAAVVTVFQKSSHEHGNWYDLTATLIY
jgi:hypothetical protein